jgi:hypothetical protein
VGRAYSRFERDEKFRQNLDEKSEERSSFGDVYSVYSHRIILK